MTENNKTGLGKVWNGAKKPFRWIKSKFSKPAEFFAAGNRGGCIALAALGSQITYAGLLCAMFSLHTIMPRVLLIVLAVPVYLLSAWLTRLALRLISGKTRYSKIFFLLTWFVMSLFPIMASQGDGVGVGLLLAFAVTLAADILGRVLWNIFSKSGDGQKKRSVTGYILGGLSLVLLIAFVVFFNLQTFGDNLIEPYLADKAAASPAAEKAGDDFAAYIGQGSKNVLTLDYGPSDESDIKTGTFDLSDFASRDGLSGSVIDAYWDYSLEEAPIAGRIWYPEGSTNCPVMFIVHGNHDYDVPSYLGYDYLGEYLGSHGYVVVSVDENSCNGLGDENDARAVLLLENIKALYKLNSDSSSPLYGLIDENRAALAGHSRGGEMVATAYYFNDLDVYPDNGSIEFDYHFPIRSIIAIAPVVDQYMPAGRPVEIEDVSYLLLHGANDQDVSTMCGEKQLRNITFTGDKRCFKTSLYIMGANHGQFNTRWGRYDMVEGANQFLNVNNFISEQDQQQIAKTYILTFLDTTVKSYAKYKSLFYNTDSYADYLPRTVYMSTYQSSDYECINDFDDDANIAIGTMGGAEMTAGNVDTWTEQLRIRGNGGEGENHVLYLKWGGDDETSSSDAEKDTAMEGPAYVRVSVPSLDLSEKTLVFDMCDMREEDGLEAVGYVVTLTDENGSKAESKTPTYIYPSLKVQLAKTDALFGTFGYKHQMQTVYVRPDTLRADSGFDAGSVCEITVSFPDMESGELQIDNLGLESINY